MGLGCQVTETTETTETTEAKGTRARQAPRRDRPALDSLAAFVRIARLGSFTAAARELGVTASALSHGLRQLEADLGVRLLNRTTRSVSPTEAGQSLLTRLEPTLAEVRAALQQVRNDDGVPRGRLRLNVPRLAARTVVAPLLGEFHARCPLVRLEIVTDDGLIDIVEAGFDAGIRFGESLALDMVSIPLRPVPRFIVVGTPGYFAAHGRPRHPADLATHACINRRFPSGELYAWEFARHRQAMQVRVDGPLILDDDAMIVAAACSGIGLAYVAETEVAKQLAGGELETALESWCPPSEGLFLYFPGRRLVPPALREWISLLQAQR